MSPIVFSEAKAEQRRLSHSELFITCHRNACGALNACGDRNDGDHHGDWTTMMSPAGGTIKMPEHLAAARRLAHGAKHAKLTPPRVNKKKSMAWPKTRILRVRFKLEKIDGLGDFWFS